MTLDTVSGYIQRAQELRTMNLVVTLASFSANYYVEYVIREV